MKTRVLILALIVIVAVAGAAYYIILLDSTPEPTPTPVVTPTPSTSPTPFSTPTHTPILTPIPTPTPKPTPTPTPTSTPTPTTTPFPTPSLIPPPSPSSTPTPTPTSTQQVVWSDGRVWIVLWKVERDDVIPPDVKETLYRDLPGLPPRKVPPLSEGQEYFFIHFKIDRIENVHVVSPFTGHGDEESILLDAEGHEYWVADYGLWCNLTDPQHTGDPELEEGATGILIFVVPKHAKLVKLTFLYSFKETWEEEYANRGQIDIIL